MRANKIKKILILPSKFTLSEEREFQKNYKEAGLHFSKIALIISLVIVLVFLLLLSFLKLDTQASTNRQLLRVLLIVILALAILNLNYRSTQVIRSYSINLGIPIAICCITVGMLGFVPLDSGEFASNRFIAAMILTCWLRTH